MPKRADLNQFEIIQKLRSIGVSVQPLYVVGFGCPDILAGWQNKNFLMEIKTDKGKLDDYQKKFMENWKGQVAVIHSWEEAFQVIGIKI
jgi:hypothetical protein